MTPQESGELCLLSGLLGENRDIFFPKLSEKLHLITLALTFSLCLMVEASSSLKVPAGTVISFKLSQKVNYKETPAGTTFRAVSAMDVINDDGDILIEEGSTYLGKVKMGSFKASS